MDDFYENLHISVDRKHFQEYVELNLFDKNINTTGKLLHLLE